MNDRIDEPPPPYREPQTSITITSDDTLSPPTDAAVLPMQPAPLVAQYPEYQYSPVNMASPPPGPPLNGLVGLRNLGNTCFMNSALQCLSNTKLLKEYFISGRHKDDVNIDNPLGMRGEMSTAFAELMQALWNGSSSSSAPSAIKTLISRRYHQFEGYGQHDSQEFLTFLLDTLHEDLNRVKVKESTTVEDGAGRDDSIVSKCAWDAHLKRNQSIIVDTMQGQYKSKLECPKCHRISVTYDPYTMHSVPIPEEISRDVPVTLISYNPEIPMNTYSVKVDKHGTIKDLKDAFVKMLSDARITPDNLILTEVYNGIYKLYTDKNDIDDIKDTDTMVYYHVRHDAFGSEPIAMIDAGVAGAKVSTYYSSNSTIGVPMLVTLDKKTTYIEFMIDVRTMMNNILSALIKKREDNASSSSPSYNYVTNARAEPVGYDLPHNHPDIHVLCTVQEPRLHTYTSYSYSQQEPVERDLTMCILRPDKMEKPSAPVEQEMIKPELARDYAGVPCGYSDSPVQSQAPGHIEADITDTEMSIEPSQTESILRQMYDDATPLYTRTTVCLYDYLTSSMCPLNDSFKSTFKSAFVTRNQTKEPAVTTKPYYSSYGYSNYEAAPKVDLKVSIVFNEPESQVASDWASVSSNVSHQLKLTPKSSGNMPKSEITLDQCFEAFTKEEVLGENDSWYCPTCKEHVQASKKVDLYKVPEVLVVHLKRFVHSKYYTDKLSTFVSFPVEGLDVCKFVVGPQSQGPLIYDLYAVSNHLGSLFGGHYIAYAKGEDGAWYDFDDSHVSPLTNFDRIVSASAYVLFYRRRK